MTASCEVYDPPPEVKIERTETGTFLVGDTIRLKFSEPINTDTVFLRVWPDERDLEGEFLEETTPLQDSCNGGTCGDLDMVWRKRKDGEIIAVDLSFNPKGLGKPGSPLIIEVEQGLEDTQGRATGVPYYYDVQFRGESAGLNTEPVVFDDGTFILHGSITHPVPVVLTMICDIKTLTAGDMALTCAEANQTKGAAQNTTIPEELLVNDTDIGFTVYAQGFIQIQEDKRRLLQTEPFDIFVPLGILDVRINGVRITGEVIENKTSGKTDIAGSLSYEALAIVRQNKSFDYEADSAPVELKYVDEARRKSLTGHPKLCNDLCGKVVGSCMPPKDFPGAAFCMPAN